jgi:hypothetical protein
VVAPPKSLHLTARVTASPALCVLPVIRSATQYVAAKSKSELWSLTLEEVDAIPVRFTLDIPLNKQSRFHIRELLSLEVPFVKTAATIIAAIRWVRCHLTDSHVDSVTPG